MSEAVLFDELVRVAAAAMLQAWDDTPGPGPGPDTEDEARAMLAVVVPLIRDQVALEIEARGDGEVFRECAAVARGTTAPDGPTVQVHISADYYEHEQFDLDPKSWWSKDSVYEVPQGQVARWGLAEEAWGAAQEEMRELMSARAAARMAVEAERRRREAEHQQRQDARRAEIRAALYGGKKR